MKVKLYSEMKRKEILPNPTLREPDHFEELSTIGELHGLDLRRMKYDQDKYRADLKAAKREIEEIRQNFNSDRFVLNNGKKESELRNYIHHLVNRTTTRDLDKNKETLDEMYDQILKNIKQIHEKVYQEMDENKKDIENRIDIRLADSDFKQRRLLENTVKQQQSSLRTLHTFTQDMNRVRENFEHVRQKIERFRTQNAEMEEKIVKAKEKNKFIKNEMKNYKIALKQLEGLGHRTENNPSQTKSTNLNLNTLTNYKTFLPTKTYYHQTKTTVYSQTASKTTEILNKTTHTFHSKLKKLRQEIEKLALHNQDSLFLQVTDCIRKVNPSSPIKTKEGRRLFTDLLCRDKNVLSLVYNDSCPPVKMLNRNK